MAVTAARLLRGLLGRIPQILGRPAGAERSQVFVTCFVILFVCAEARADSTNSRARSATVVLPSDWSGRSAITQPLAHGQIALFGESRIGVGRELQLGLHVAGFAALAPNTSLLYRFLHHGAWHASARLGVAYPRPTLSLLTGTGAGALLPADTTPPQALLFDSGMRGSLELPRTQLLTFEGALTLATKFTHTQSPLLDFPFLYPRFAALHTPVTIRFAVTGEGVIMAAFRWVGAVETWILPVVERGFAIEPRLGLAWVAKRRVTLEVGNRASYARYPVGVRFHDTPYFDLRVRF